MNIDFFDRPEKLKKPKDAKAKLVDMLPEEKKAHDEKKKVEYEERKKKKAENPDMSVTETSDGPDFSNTSSVESDDVNFE